MAEEDPGELYSPTFYQAVAELQGVEGQFSNHRNDRGGKTSWGITKGVARNHGYEGPMEDLRWEEAVDIYWQGYWNHRRLLLEEVAKRDPATAKGLFDIAVNMGVGDAAWFFQRALNIFNKQEALYPDLSVDRWIGPRTLEAYDSYRRKRINQKGDLVMRATINCIQGYHYIVIGEKDPTQEDFEYGWFLQRIVNLW